MARLDHLPVELISAIMEHITVRRHLIQCNLINRSFHVATLPLLWRRLTIDNGQYRNFITSLRQQHLMGRHIRRLDFNLYRLTDKQLLTVMNHVGQQLEELSIRYGRQITNTSFQHVPQHYPRLTFLCLEHSPITIDPCIQQLGHHCHQLTHLLLTNCRAMDASIFGILVHCPLRYVLFNKSVTGYLHKDDSQLRLMSSYGRHPEQFIMQVLTTNHLWLHLTHLTIQGSCGPNEHDTIIPFLQTHVHLKEIKLQRGTLTDATLDTIGIALRDGITKVNVSWNPQLTSRGIRRLVHRCRQLTGLSFDACGMTALDFPDLVAADRRPRRPRQQQQHWPELLALFHHDDDDDDDDDMGIFNNNNNNNNNNEMAPRQPNFTGLGRLKIMTIRQHSNVAGDYQP
ncbi:unnamed protein product [Absidia cylindrospora]